MSRVCRTASGSPKVRYETRAMARRAARLTSGTFGRMSDYHCPDCGYFHIGHRGDERDLSARVTVIASDGTRTDYIGRLETVPDPDPCWCGLKRELTKRSSAWSRRSANGLPPTRIASVVGTGRRWVGTRSVGLRGWTRSVTTMQFAYADPPYLGYCSYYTHHHPDGRCWDELGTHEALIERLAMYDGWAMSLSSPSLRNILPLCPPDVRVMAWCKSFASYKPGIHPAYAWEPVIIRGPQKRGRGETTVADFHVARITLERGLTGAKPESFVWWVLAALNVKADDEFVDLFPGSGAVTRAWERWQAQAPLGLGA